MTGRKVVACLIARQGWRPYFQPPRIDFRDVSEEFLEEWGFYFGLVDRQTMKENPRP